MRGRAFILEGDELRGAFSVTEMPMSPLFVTAENKAPADHARNLHGKTAAVGITTSRRTRPHAVSRFVNSIQHMFTLATILFFILSPKVLDLMGWHYWGGGAAYQCVHIATYLLITTFTCLWLIDPRFRGNVTRLSCTDWTLISFALVVGATASYAVLVKHVSITPFVDTFLAALLVTIGWICLPAKNLRLLRNLLDIYFVTNIAILFLEYATKSWVMFTPDIAGEFRAVAFFEHPLSAASLLGVYSIANLTSIPINFTRQCLFRLTLGFASLLAIFTTGGRTATAATILILFAFLAISAVRQIASGRINRAAVVYGFFAFPVVAICVLVLLQFGFFDTMVSRMEYDASAATRQVALDLVSNMPTGDLWFGLPPSDLGALVQRQAELNLIAIEISWANFVLTSGVIFTVPLFATYVLFLFRFLPRYCGAPAILTSVLLLIVTAANNGIWAKTTVLTTSFAVILAFFRTSNERSSRSAASVASQKISSGMPAPLLPSSASP